MVEPRAFQTDSSGEFDWDVVRSFWDLGVLQVILPEEYGGWAHHPSHTLCLCVEEIAKACASSALLLIIQAVGGFPLVHAGNDLQKSTFLPRISRGRELIGYLVTEPNAGSDVQGISTTATPEGESFVLSGNKIFATNGGVASLYSVLTKTEEGDLTFFLVERTMPGVSIGRVENKCGFRGSNTAEVILEDVRVPRQNMLGNQGDGFAIAMADFDMSRPLVAALALGIAEGSLHIALDYAMNHSVSGEPLVERQGIQFFLADASARIEAGRGLMEKAALLHDRGEPNTRMASTAKCFCSDSAMKITSDMLQVLAEEGLSADYSLERRFRDAKLTQIFEGTNEIQRIVMARELIKERTGRSRTHTDAKPEKKTPTLRA